MSLRKSYIIADPAMSVGVLREVRRVNRLGGPTRTGLVAVAAGALIISSPFLLWIMHVDVNDFDALVLWALGLCTVLFLLAPRLAMYNCQHKLLVTDSPELMALDRRWQKVLSDLPSGHQITADMQQQRFGHMCEIAHAADIEARAAKYEGAVKYLDAITKLVPSGGR